MGKGGSAAVIQVMVLTAVVVAPLVLFGVYLGYYLGGVSGYSKSIMAIVFSTVGFLVAIAILSKAIVRIVGRSGRSRT